METANKYYRVRVSRAITLKAPTEEQAVERARKKGFLTMSDTLESVDEIQPKQ